MKKHVWTLLLALLIAVGGVQAAGMDGITVEQPVRNIILLIPDGMSNDGVTLARWYQGGAPLALDAIASGLVRTHSSDAAIADSAPAGTAFATGFKSHTGFIGVLPDENTMPGLDPLADGDQRRPVANILEAARLSGRATGIIATSEIMHATPADFSAHDPSRKNYDALSEQQVFQGMDVVLGAGMHFFTAEGRKDGDDLTGIIKENYQYVNTPEQLAAVSEGKVWGMFAGSALDYDMDRDPAKQPSLADMTGKAIELLSKNEKGFFLMVEGSKVDWAAHANDPIGIISDILAFDKAVGVALDFAAKDGSTLVIAVSDHGNSGISIGDEGTTGDYDKRPLADFIEPLKRAKLTGEGLAQKLKEDRSNIREAVGEYYGIDDLSDEEVKQIEESELGSLNYTVGPMMGRRAHIGFTTGGHTGGDVVLYVSAPEGLTTLTGVVDNTDIAKYMAKAFGLSLAEATDRLFVRAIPAFEQKGAKVEVDETDSANPAIVVTKENQQVRIIINRSTATVNGEQVKLDGVAVRTSDLFVPQSAVDLIK